MTEHEVLSAMSTMLEPIHGRLDKMDAVLYDVKADINDMKAELSEVKIHVKNIELTQENVIIPRLNNIEACYISTYERYKNNADDIEFAIKHDIPIMKQVLTKHSNILKTTP